MLRSGLFACLIVAGLGSASPLLAQSSIYIPAILELSGAGAVSGTNFRDGMLLAIDEINAKGGILGRKIETPVLDTQSDAGTSRAQIQKVLDNNPYVILGPVFSGSVLVDMALTQQAEIPEIVGGEAAAITQKNDPYVFRTSFGQQFSMPKIANYIRDGVKAKSVAVVWVNNDFGKGGRDTFIKEMTARNIKVAARADLVLVPAALEQVIVRLLRSELRPGTNDNDVNAIQHVGGGLRDYIVDEFLTSPFAWFVKTDKRGLIYYERVPFEMDMYVDFDTDNLKVKGRERYAFSYFDWRSVWGSFPTS